MDAIKRESQKACEWLVDEPIEHWARFTFDLEVKFPDNTTNFVENFNGKIKKYRYKPIFKMFEAVRKKFMKTISNRAKLANQCKGRVVPRVKLLLVKTEKESRGCRLTLFGKRVFKVIEGLLNSQLISTKITMTTWCVLYLGYLANMLQGVSSVKDLALNHL